MEPQQQVFCFLSPEVEALLADNHTDLADLLRREGLDVSRGAAQSFTLSAAPGQKEPVSVIIASAAVAVALTPILSRLIEALSNRPVVVEEQALIPVEDSKGNPIIDDAGKPVLQWVNRKRILASEHHHNQERSSVEIKGPLGLSITYNASSNP